MNILFLATHLNVGGITNYVLSLSRGLKARGHAVYAASSGGECLGAFVGEGVHYIPIPIKTKSEVDPRIIFSALKLISCIRKNNIDIIHANTRVTQVLACLLHKLSGRPYISTCHGFFKARILRRNFPCWGARVVAVSEQVKEHLRHDFKVREEAITVIHNGLDFSRFSVASAADKREAKKKFGLGESRVVGIIARLSHVKGHVYLIEAMKRIREKIPDVRLLIIGEGREKRNLAELVRRLSIEESIFFVDSLMNTPEALAAMDVFVMPSLEEGLGLSLMEAMACGVPVVGSAVGGIKSLIRDGETGLLVPAADVSALSMAIERLLLDKDKAENCAVNARSFVTENFSQEEMVAKTEKVYLECLN